MIRRRGEDDLLTFVIVIALVLFVLLMLAVIFGPLLAGTRFYK